MEEARFYAQTIVNKKIADKYAQALEQAAWPEAMSITWFETHDESQEWDLRAYYEFEHKIDRTQVILLSLIKNILRDYLLKSILYGIFFA